jgi:multidrug efflux system membrane fusion protein
MRAAACSTSDVVIGTWVVEDEERVSMEARGMPKKSRMGALAVSVAVIAAASAVAIGVGYSSHPATDDSTIDADIVHVAAAVGGRVIELPVHENDPVHQGDLLFQIDPVPYRLALNQAAANLDVARAAVETQRRIVSTQKSNAAIAGEQARRAETNHGLTLRTQERLQPLADKGYVPQQQLDQAQVAARDATTSLRQAQEQERAARRAVDTLEAAVAAVRAAEAALANAQRALDDTTVRAHHDGRIVGLTVSTGEMVLPSQALFTLVNTEEWFAIANMRETDIGSIAVGDCATVYSMIDRATPIKGIVQGIGWGVLDDDRINLPRSVPYVKPSVNWVRVAHRFPVRVRLETPPQALLRLGASASVQVRHGAACR